MTTVVRARRYLPAGESVDPDGVRVVGIPTAFVEPESGFVPSPNCWTRQAGPLFRFARRRHESERKLRAPSSTPPAAASLGHCLLGETAMAIRLSREDAVAGDLSNPATRRMRGFWRTTGNGGKQDGIVRLLLPLARVIAVQDRPWHRPPGLRENDVKTIAEESVFVTLMITPQDAARLALATQHGSLQLSLASPLDAEPPVVEALRLEQLNKGE